MKMRDLLRAGGRPTEAEPVGVPSMHSGRVVELLRPSHVHFARIGRRKTPRPARRLRPAPPPSSRLRSSWCVALFVVFGGAGRSSLACRTLGSPSSDAMLQCTRNVARAAIASDESFFGSIARSFSGAGAGRPLSRNRGERTSGTCKTALRVGREAPHTDPADRADADQSPIHSVCARSAQEKRRHFSCHAISRGVRVAEA